MFIKWHGHACFEIRDGIRIIIDPHDGRSIGIKPPRATADLVLVTHDHFDHNAVHVINGNFQVVSSGGEYNFENAKIKGIGAYHDEVMGAKRGRITMYKILLEGISLLHMGDIGHILTKDQVREIGNVDIIFIPVGGIYTVDAKKAYENTKILNPKIVIPMHYKVPGLTLGIGSVNGFLSFFPKEKIMYVGNSIEFGRRDLPSQTSVWVFTI